MLCVLQPRTAEGIINCNPEKDTQHPQSERLLTAHPGTGNLEAWVPFLFRLPRAKCQT